MIINVHVIIKFMMKEAVMLTEDLDHCCTARFAPHC